ncbi:MAG: type IX secretion system outer membrane channel protein PorV [Marinilabiliaceae bacterium]|nr:type IX secretion system outer membrane channel protein PorV [Marinilabiliaceae bacterium]
MRGITFSKILVIVAIFTISNKLYSQDDTYDKLSGQQNIIPTAIPFLGISPDSRAAGMGDAGAATTPDLNSQAYNPAKYAFLDADLAVAASVTPWLPDLVDDINLYYLAGFYRIDKMQTISTSLRYFSLGTITFRESLEDAGYPVKPNEFAIDAAYSRLLSDKISGSVAFRYIRSDLSGGKSDDMQAGNSFAADVSFFYNNPKIKLGRQKSNLALGVNISNIGNKISYDGGNTKQFIPTNLRLGGALSTDIDKYNSIMFTLDFNKLLVPTPNIVDSSTTFIEAYGNASTITGMINSFTDAPGGFEEELNEIKISAGLEYWYNKQFAIRGGYFHEHETKGNRKYMTAGIGLKFNVFTIDASYIIAVAQNNPLANTIRFSLAYNFSDM